jgi:LDH2 family malate/lactate/ureidoglycolate dehydrogenase
MDPDVEVQNSVIGNVAALTTEPLIVPAGEIKDLIEEVLLAHGANAADADTQAAFLLEGNLRDQQSHGLQRLDVLVGRIRNGVLRCDTTPEMTWVTDVALRVDGHAGFGPVVAHRTISELIARADRTGIALGLIHNSNHLGMLAPYVERIAKAGQIGIVTTTSEALVHPFGGAKAMVGTNPFAMGVPTEGEPFALDMSTGSISMGKILSYAERGEPMPLGWAIDADGQPTTDAVAAKEGAISPFGGAKGYALGLALELLVASLTGTAMGDAVTGTLDKVNGCTKGDVLLCFSPIALGLSAARVASSTQQYLDDVRESPRANPAVPIAVPGDRARRSRDHRLGHGVPLDRGTWSNALALLNEARNISELRAG